MNSLEPGFLRGSYPPVITPFLENGDVDYDSYEKLVDWQIREGSHGIVVNGTSAEPAVLTTEERKTLLEIGIRVAKGRVPVMAATGSQSFAETAVLTDHAAKQGADALLIVTPYYIRPPQRGLVAYYNELGKRSDLPLLMYHIPGPRRGDGGTQHLGAHRRGHAAFRGHQACLARFGAGFGSAGQIRAGVSYFRGVGRT